MKNIILIISLIVCSYNAIGAVKISRTGLEGWGKKGVDILVKDYSEVHKNFPLKAIKTKVELRLFAAYIDFSMALPFILGNNFNNSPS